MTFRNGLIARTINIVALVLLVKLNLFDMLNLLTGKINDIGL